MQQVHNDNILIKWCKRQNYFLTSATKKSKGETRTKETHLLLNGGRLCIPNDSHRDFIKKMAEALMHEQAWLYVVEMKTNPGRFFVELDLLLWDKWLTKNEIIGILMVPFSRVIKAAFPDKNTMAVICNAEATVVEKVRTFNKLINLTPF